MRRDTKSKLTGAKAITLSLATLTILSGCASKEPTLSESLQSNYEDLKGGSQKTWETIKDGTSQKYQKTKSWINKKSNSLRD
jgi:outer membrane lipoprotein-sorting protein